MRQGLTVTYICVAVAVVIVVERHQHLRRELIAAIVVSSVAGVMIVLAALYFFFLWRRSRRALVDSRDTQSIGLGLLADWFMLSSLTCLVAHEAI